MGKHKTQRTEQLRQAGKRLLLAEQITNTLEQHNFNRLIAQGTIVEGGACEKALPPKGAGRALSTTCP